MHKRALQTLKRMFMHVSGPPHQILMKKPNIYKLVFLSKHSGGRTETCINVRIRP